MKDEGLHLTILRPNYIPRARGIHSLNAFGTYMKARCTLDEYNLVEEASAKCGMTKSMFVRWVMVHAAKEILNEHAIDPEPD